MTILSDLLKKASLLKARPTKYISRTPKKSGRGWDYVYKQDSKPVKKNDFKLLKDMSHEEIQSNIGKKLGSGNFSDVLKFDKGRVIKIAMGENNIQTRFSKKTPDLIRDLQIGAEKEISRELTFLKMVKNEIGSSLFIQKGTSGFIEYKGQQRFAFVHEDITPLQDELSRGSTGDISIKEFEFIRDEIYKVYKGTSHLPGDELQIGRDLDKNIKIMDAGSFYTKDEPSSEFEQSNIERVYDKIKGLAYRHGFDRFIAMSDDLLEKETERYKELPSFAKEDDFELKKELERRGLLDITKKDKINSLEFKSWFGDWTKGEGSKKPVKQWIDHVPGMPEQTVHKYFIDGKPDTGPIASRKQLHDTIAKSYFEGTTPVSPNEKPVAIMMMGGPASGKSGMVNSSGANTLNFVNADADDVKGKLPEYREAVSKNAKDAAWMVHEESSFLVKRVRQQAIDENRNIIIDGTGSNIESYEKNLKLLKEKGYHVKLMLADCTFNIAAPRSIDRAEKAGRYVPMEILERSYGSIPKNFEAFSKKVDEFYVFDTRDGFPPKIVWSRENGQEKIHNKKWHSQFMKNKSLPAKLQKADEPVNNDRKPAVETSDILKMMMSGATEENNSYNNKPKKYRHDEGIKDVMYELDDPLIEISKSYFSKFQNLFKATKKYKRRWKGKDGKWQYEYYEKIQGEIDNINKSKGKYVEKAVKQIESRTRKLPGLNEQVENYTNMILDDIGRTPVPKKDPKKLTEREELELLLKEKLASSGLKKAILSILKARDISKLTKKIITDKRGHRRIVYVRTDKESKQERLGQLKEKYKGKEVTAPDSQALRSPKDISKMKDKIAEHSKDGQFDNIGKIQNIIKNDTKTSTIQKIELMEHLGGQHEVLLLPAPEQGTEKITNKEIESVKKTVNINDKSDGKGIELVDLDSIKPEVGGQVRKEFDPDKLRQLATAIAEQGLLQNLVVRPDRDNPGKYKLIAGERRWRALNMLKKEGKFTGKIQVIVKDVDDKEKDIMQLTENNIRENNTPIEISDLYVKLVKEHGMSVGEIAKKTGKSTTYIKEHLNIENLHKELRKMLSKGEISKSHASLIGGIKEHNQQISIFNQMLQKNWTVRQLKDYISGQRNQMTFFTLDDIMTPKQKSAKKELEKSGVSEFEAIKKFHGFLGKHKNFINKFLDADGSQLSSNAMTATGNYELTMKHMNEIKSTFERVMNLMEKENSKHQTDDMFKATTLRDIMDKKSFLKDVENINDFLKAV